jgi:hypothetical protein
MEDTTQKALRDFAKFLDEGFNCDEPLAQNNVDAFISSRQGIYNKECSHEWAYLGDGDSQCIKCYIIR